MSEDNTINQEPCSYEQLAKTMKEFIKNTMMSFLELYEHFEELAMHIKNANDFMEKIKTQKLESAKKFNVIPINLLRSGKKQRKDDL